MTHDSINSPSHYAEGRQFETISVIEDWELGYRLGNAVKYISRAGRKDPEKTLEDLKKAQWYLAREIESIEGIKPFERSYEEIVESLRFYGESQDNPIAWPEPDGSGFDSLLDTDGWGAAEYVPFDATKDAISFDVDEHDWEDFWTGGWDDSVGPVEVSLSQEEIQAIMSKKDLNSFEDDEIIATIEKREMILGVKKDGSTCVLKDGRCT